MAELIRAGAEDGRSALRAFLGDNPLRVVRESGAVWLRGEGFVYPVKAGGPTEQGRRFRCE